MYGWINIPMDIQIYECVYACLHVIICNHACMPVCIYELH